MSAAADKFVDVIYEHLDSKNSFELMKIAGNMRRSSVWRHLEAEILEWAYEKHTEEVCGDT